MKLTKSILIVGLSGLIWNLYGIFQFISSLLATTESLQKMGMTADQASLLSSYPIWMDFAFGIGTVGGALGCILLLARTKQSVVVFAASLIAYLALFVGDVVYGIFAAIGLSQVLILSFVVVVALGLLVFSCKLFKNPSPLGDL